MIHDLSPENTRPARSFPGSRISHLWLWLAAVLSPMLWMWPKFANPSFSLIDDPNDIRTFHFMAAHFGEWWKTGGFHGEVIGGRLRPMYWLSRFLFHYMLLPSKHSAFEWYTVHYLTLAAILSAVFYLILKIARSAAASLTACLLWVLNAKTMENFTRLSPAEDWQLLWFILAAVLVYRLFRPGRRTGPLSAGIFILWFFFYYSKETSVLLLPACLLFWTGSLLLRRGQKEWTILLALNLLLFTSHRLLSPPMVGYSSQFVISPRLFAGNLMLYISRVQWLWLVIAAAVSFSVREGRRLFQVRRDYFDPLSFWQAGFLVLGIEFFLILLPWALPEPRYLVMTDFFFAVFTGIELFRNLAWLEENPAVRKWTRNGRWFRTCYFVFCLLLSLTSTASLLPELRYAYGQAGHPSPVQDLKIFAEHAPAGAKVLVFYLELEPLHSALVLLKDFFGRGDIRVYSFSGDAASPRNHGYNVVQIGENEWPAVLEDIDYILWTRRGSKKLHLDLVNAKVIRMIMESEYGLHIRELYSSLYFPYHPQIPEGSQIWQINHEAVREYRRAMQQKASAASVPASP